MSSSKLKYLFVSHAREDRELLDEIRTYTDCLSEIELWDDSNLSPGLKWDQSISEAINNSYAALLLISQFSLRSEFIWQREVPRLIDSGIPVSWLKVRECPWDISTRSSVIKSIQALRDPSIAPFSSLNGANRESELNIIIRHLSEFSLCSRGINKPLQQAISYNENQKPQSSNHSKTNTSKSLSDQLHTASEYERIASLAVFNAIHDLATEGRCITLTEINEHPAVIKVGLRQEDPAALRKTIIILLRAGLLPGVLLRPEGLLLEEEHFALKTQKEVAEKQAIAKESLKKIMNGSLILMDAGSTTLAIAELLGNALATQMLTDISIVTHSPAHAVKLLEIASAEGWTEKETPLKVIIAGGILRPETEACVEESGLVGPIDAFKSAISSHSGPTKLCWCQRY